MPRNIDTIHGYNSDLYSSNADEPPTGQQCEFSEALAPHQTQAFNWFSAVQWRWVDVVRALYAGHTNTYAWTYKKLSMQAAVRYLNELSGRKGKANVFAHSLGSRVALAAVQKLPYRFNRICLINAAERVETAMEVLESLPAGVEILNVCVRNDDVLDKAVGFMSPGISKEKILGQDGLSLADRARLRCKFHQIFLDDPATQQRLKKKHGWDLRGDNPKDYGDHHLSYRHPGNWALYEAFYSGELEI